MKKSPSIEATSPLHSGKLPLPDGYQGDHSHGSSGSFTSTRRARHRGRELTIETTYRILVDGEALQLHTSVLDDGSVHCHGLPNYTFPSAVDLARSLVDASLLARSGRDELGERFGCDDQGQSKHHGPGTGHPGGQG